MDFIINDLKDGYSTLKVSRKKVADPIGIERDTPPRTKKPLYKYVVPIVIPLILYPTIGFAAGPFDMLHDEFLKIADILALAVFSFAGASWMFGHRSKGLEMLICGCIGYLIIRHSVDIRDYLKYAF